MRKTFLTKTNVNLCTNTVQLDIKLGAWLPVHRNTKYTTYRTHDKAYRRTGKGFIEYTNPTCSHLFTINKTTLRLPLNSHPIESSHDTTELWTSHQYNTLPITPQPPTKAHITKPHDGQQRAGSDASVNPINGESSCAYTVRIGNQSITGSERYQQSQYMTSYRAELQ
eukprot:8077026-Ditylum_brightwellii.AAC.1